MFNTKLKSCIAAFASAALVISAFVIPVSAADLTISTAAELASFRDAVNDGTSYTGKTIELTADIDLSTVCGESTGSWTPIGLDDGRSGRKPYFDGHFNGNGHTISGLYIDAPFTSYIGLFGYVSNGAVIEDLTVEGSVSGGTLDAAGIVGMVSNNSPSASNAVTLRKLTNKVNVTSPAKNVGGVAGYITNYTIAEQLSNEGAITVDGSTYVGGVLGDMRGKANDLTNRGTISGSAVSAMGGVVGYMISSSATASGMYNHGSVSNTYSPASGSTYTAGVVGSSDTISSDITMLANTGSVSGAHYTAGVIGKSSKSIINAYNTGTVTGSGDAWVCGISTSLTGSALSNVYNTGSVTNTNNAEKSAAIAYYVTSTGNNIYYSEGAASGIYRGKNNTSDTITTVPESRTAAQFASGEMAYLLEHLSAGVWGQEIGKDASPVFNAEKPVYKSSFYKTAEIDGEFVENVTSSDGTVYQTYKYTNSNGEIRYFCRKADGDTVKYYYDDAYTEEHYEDYLKGDISGNYSEMYDSITVKEYKYINGNAVESLDAVSYANAGGRFTAPEIDAPADSSIRWAADGSYSFNSPVSGDAEFYAYFIKAAADNTTHVGKIARPGTGIYAETNATGFITTITTTAENPTISRITWNVTSGGITKHTSLDKNITLAADAEVRIALIIDGLNDPEAVVTAVTE